MANTMKGSGEPLNPHDDNLTAQNSAVNTSGAYSEHVTDPPQPQRLPLPPAPNLAQPSDIDAGNTGIPVELLQIIGQLRHINNWFYLYRENRQAWSACVSSALMDRQYSR